MNPQSHSNHSDGEELTLSQDSAGPMVYTITTQTVARQRFPNPFSIDQTAIQRQYNLSPDFCDYTETSHTDMTQGWAIPQQQLYPDSSNQAFANSSQGKSAQQSFSPEVFQLLDTKSTMGIISVIEEDDHILNPTCRREEVSDQRKEVRWFPMVFRICIDYGARSEFHVFAGTASHCYFSSNAAKCLPPWFFPSPLTEIRRVQCGSSVSASKS